MMMSVSLLMMIMMSQMLIIISETESVGGRSQRATTMNLKLISSLTIFVSYKVGEHKCSISM